MVVQGGQGPPLRGRVVNGDGQTEWTKWCIQWWSGQMESSRSEGGWSSQTESSPEERRAQVRNRRAEEDLRWEREERGWRAQL